MTDMEITRVGFGAWAVGGSWEYGWGPQSDEESINAIRHAVDQGVNWIDTAAIYGLGHSEKVVAQALKGVSDRPYVFTKCGMIWYECSAGRSARSSRISAPRCSPGIATA